MSPCAHDGQEPPSPRTGSSSLAGRALGWLRGAAPGAVLGSRRSSVPARGSAHVALRGVHRADGGKAARKVEAFLQGLPGVMAAEVNAALGDVMLTYDPDGLDVADLLDAVVAAEQALGLDDGTFAETKHPADDAAVARELWLALGYGAGATAAVLGRVMKLPSVPPALATVLGVVETAPPLRRIAATPLGRALTGAATGLGVSVTQTLAQLPTTLAVEAVHRVSLATETRARRSAWHRLRRKLEPWPGSYRAHPVDIAPRPVPLPGGPIEGYLDAAFKTSVAASAVIGGLTRSRRRALGALATGSSRSARLGREAFVAQLGRLLASRDAVVMDPAVLARLDRVDVVVLDSSALLTGDRVVDEVLPLAEDISQEELLLRTLALADLRTLAPARSGEWSIRPVGPGDAVPADAARRARQWRRRGDRILVLARDGTPKALVDVVDELEPIAEALASVSDSHTTVVIADNGKRLARRLGIARVVTGGDQLQTSIRALQEEGHVVALVAADHPKALAAADVGIAVPRGPQSVPWGAHLICTRGAKDAYLVLQALPSARRLSSRSVRLTAAAAAVAVILALFASTQSVERRTLTVLALAAVGNLGFGTWSALPLGAMPPPVPAERTPWHAMPPEVALRLLGSSPEGLDDAEAERRLQDDDVTASRGGWALTSAEEIANPVSAALAVSAGMSATVGSVLDAVLITGVLALNALIGGVQRAGTNRALHRLVDASAVRVRLRRGGRTAVVTAEGLVPGDVVHLHAGDAVPADCRILAAAGLEVDESTLTGESQPVAKAAAAAPAAAVAERSSMLYEGTSIAAGTCRAVVVSTGSRTELGRTVQAAASAPAADGVEARLRSLTRLTIPVSVSSGVVLLVVTLLRGRQLGAALGPAVNLAVAAIPEGLPFVATIAELAAARRLSTRGALVRRPSTMEALGRVEVLCFDKTGTLTEGRITLRLVGDGEEQEPPEALSAELSEVVAAALRASPEGEPESLPHPTDRAVVAGARSIGVTPVGDLGSWQRVAELPFEPGRGYHAVLGQDPAGSRLSVKGAPEVVLERCASSTSAEGGSRPLTEGERRRLAEHAHRLARAGYRVLAVAERPAAGADTLDDSQVHGLRFTGFLGLGDAVRPTAAAAVRGLRDAGVQIVMVTGDHPGTAEAIAGEVDALDGRRVMTGAELDGVSDDDLADVLRSVGVFARVTPSQKSRIVQGLRRTGTTVAVTGDGANDAAAIRLADVGIALGRNATAAAREAADIVVTDDRIETIVAAILEGRAMWASVRDALAILLGGNLGEIGFTLGAVLLAADEGLTTRQLLLVNMLTDVLPASAVAVRPPPDLSPEALAREGPQSSLAGSLTRQILLRAGVTAAAAGVAFTVARMTGTAGRARTVGLVALVSAQLLQTLAMGRRSGLVLASVVGSLAALAVIVSVPGLSGFFGCQPLGPVGWATALVPAAVATLVAVMLPRLPRPVSSRAGLTSGATEMSTGR